MADPQKTFAPKFRSYESFIGNYIKQGNVMQVKSSVANLTKVRKEAKAAGIKNTPTGKAFYKEKKRFIKECERSLAELEVKAALKGITQKVDGAKRWAESSLQRKDGKGVKQYQEQMVKELTANQAKLMETPVGQQYFQEMMAFANGLDQQIALLQYKAEADKIARALHSAMGWVETHLKRKAADDAARSWKDVKRVAEPLFANQMLLQVDTVKKEMEQYYRLEQSVEGDVAQQKMDQEVEKKGRELRSQARWLQDSLNRKQPHDAIQKQQNLLGPLDAFAMSYGGHPEGQKVVDEVSALFRRVELEVQPMIDQMEAKRVAEKVNRSLNWLKSGLQHKNVDEIAKYQAEILNGLNELEQYRQIDVAQKTMSEAQAMLQRIENEMGDIIAEKEIARLSQPISSTMNWLRSAFQRKDIKQTQSFSAKLQEQLFELQRYAKYGKASTLMNVAQQLLQEVESSMGALIAEEEIRSLLSKLNQPLSFLESYLNAKDVPQVQKNRERVQQKLIPLRSKYANHALALPALQKAEALLGRIDSEVGQIIAEQEVGKVERKIRTQLSYAESAVKMKDGKMGLRALQECNRMLLPLEAQFAQFPKTNALRRDLDTATQQLGPLLQGVMDKRGAEKPLRDLNSALKPITAAVAAGDGVSAARLLKGANVSAAPLRKTYAFLPEVQEALRSLDAYNIQVLGCIPPQEELAPIFEINWKLREEEQRLLKTIKEAFEAFNKIVREVQMAFEELVSLDGSSRTAVAPDFFVTKLVQSDRPYDHPAKEYLDRAAKFAKELEGVHPSTAGDANLVLNQIQEAIPQLGKMIREKSQFWSQRTHYAILVGHAADKLREASTAIQKAEQQGMKDTAPEQYFDGLSRLNDAMSVGLRAKQYLPEDNDEAVSICEQILGYQNTTQTAAISVARQMFEKDARGGEWFYADRHERFLKEHFPHAAENQEIAQLKKQFKEEQAARAAAIKAEAERKRKEEEERLERMSQEWREKEIFPYSGGSIKVGSATWTFARTEKGGNLTCGGVSYKMYATSGGVELDGASADFGYAAFDGKRWTFTASAPRYYVTHYSFEWNPDATSFESKSGIWKIAKDHAHASGGKFKVTKTDISGAVPPSVVLLASIVDNVLAEIKPWRAVRIRYDQLYQKEDERRTEIWRNVPSSCSICNTGGSNIITCYACGSTWCKSCAGHDNCSCGAFYDNYVHVSSDWEQKTQQALGMWG